MTERCHIVLLSQCGGRSVLRRGGIKTRSLVVCDRVFPKAPLCLLLALLSERREQRLQGRVCG